MIQEVKVQKPIDGVFRWTAVQPYGPSTPIRATVVNAKVIEWVWFADTDSEERADAETLSHINAHNALVDVILGRTRYGTSPVQHSPLLTLTNPVTGAVQVPVQVGVGA